MNNSAGLIWLASFPKSGNTWTRIFLNNLLSENNLDLDLNFLRYGEIGSSRLWIEEALGIEINELSHDEIDILRPIAYRQLAKDEKKELGKKNTPIIKVHKLHDAYNYLPNGEALFPASVTQAAIILVRNPLDIVVSYANHINSTLEKSTDLICSNAHALCGNSKQFDNQLRQTLLSWNEHTGSWLNADVKKLVLRYEDLKLDSAKYFTRLCHFLGLEHTQKEIFAAIEASEFNKVRQLEIDNGFREKMSNVKHFFRKGIVGDWQKELSDEQINKIILHSAPAMRRLGYLDNNNKPLVNPLPVEQCTF